MPATTYTTSVAATLATLESYYDGLSALFSHLARLKGQLNINVIVTTIVLNPGPNPPANTISITFANALPWTGDELAKQLAHLGLT